MKPRLPTLQGDIRFRGSTSHSRLRDEGLRDAASQPGTPDRSAHGKEKVKHRGFFGKMKDKAIGTKEEREEARRREMIVSYYSSPILIVFAYTLIGCAAVC